MTTKEKAVKAVKPAVIVDSQILNQFKNLVKDDAKMIWQFIENTYAKMGTGDSSVRIAKASIAEGEKSGKHPVIKSSQVEGFGTALKLKVLDGTDKQLISDVLKVSMRARRAVSAELVPALINGVKTWVGFIDRLENAEQEKAEAVENTPEAELSEEEKEEKTLKDLRGITLDGFALLTLKYFSTLSMADAKLVDAKLGENITAGWNQIARNSRALNKVKA